jgi:hypothetical protein
LRGVNAAGTFYVTVVIGVAPARCSLLIGASKLDKEITAVRPITVIMLTGASNKSAIA